MGSKEPKNEDFSDYLPLFRLERLPPAASLPASARTSLKSWTCRRQGFAPTRKWIGKDGQEASSIGTSWRQHP